MPIKITRRSNRRIHMLPRQPHPLKQCQLPCRGHSIPDLPSIHLLRGQLVDVRLDSVKVDVLGVGAQHGEEVAPHGAAAGKVQGRVVQGDLDAGLEGRVECADAVAGEDEDAIVVFEGAEKDCIRRGGLVGGRGKLGGKRTRYEAVALEVGEAALFEEDVGLVKEED